MNDRIPAVAPFVRIDCRPVDLDIVGPRLNEEKRREADEVIRLHTFDVSSNYLCAEPVVDLSVMVNAAHCMPHRCWLADNRMDTRRSCPLMLNLSRAAEMNLANLMSPLCDWRLWSRNYILVNGMAFVVIRFEFGEWIYLVTVRTLLLLASSSSNQPQLAG